MGLFLGYAVAAQHGVDSRFLTAETAVELGWMFGASPLKYILAERLGGGRIEYATFFKQRERVGVKHLGPFVAVIAGGITA